MQELATLAAASYAPHEFGGYEIDKDLSNRNRTVYHKDGKAVISYRGTNVKNRGDLGSDALLALGLEKFSSRFRNAQKVAKQASAKYGKDNVTATGHSLGGSQALYVNRRLGVSAAAYNPGTSLSQAKEGLFERLVGVRKKKNAVIYSTGAKDPISSLSIARNVKVRHVKPTVKGALGAHSISNFLAPT